MRIAILTLPLHTNFGGILQCYALQTVLERMGHEVSILNTSFDEVDYKTRAGLLFKRLIKVILRKESKYYGWKTEGEITRQYTQAFIDEYIHIRNIRDLFLLKEGEYDAIVVGSDQIWRPLYYQPIANAYLKFAKDWTSIKRIVYAASFGVDKWEYTQEETEECASLLKLFDAVSVREQSAVELCRMYLQKNVVQLLDPTLLLTKDDYLSLIQDSAITRHKNGLFYYFLDTTQDKMNIVFELSKKYELTPFRANNPNTENYSLHFEYRVQSSIGAWIAGFEDASLVVTDSFHGCVFSIIFNKPFIVIGNTKRGDARFSSLLSMFDLEARWIKSSYSITTQQIVPILWNMVNTKLNKEREYSFSFLQEVGK